MTTFICLTLWDGRPALVNVANIDSACQPLPSDERKKHGVKSEVSFLKDDSTMEVRESVEEIYDLIWDERR